MWIKQSNANVLGGMTKMAEGLTEEQCKDACVKNSNCWTIDYKPSVSFFVDWTSSQCRYGSIPFQSSTSYSVDGTHWKLDRNCMSG